MNSKNVFDTAILSNAEVNLPAPPAARNEHEKREHMDERSADLLVLRPATDDREEWGAYWDTLKQPWRTEPEIDVQSQAYLKECLSIQFNIRNGTYPFKDINFKLQRAHIEWVIWYLGPINWKNNRERSTLGPDFRGADLRGLNLSRLPLARGRFGLSWDLWLKTDQMQRDLAAAHLEDANLWGANLEGSRFNGAYLQGVILANARLQDAEFRRSHLDAADLHSIVVENTDFTDATLSNAQGRGPRVADIEWGNTQLTLMPWSSIIVLGDETYVKKKEQEKAPHDELIAAYEVAVRAHEQVANALQWKGVDANRFRYRGKVLQRQLLWKQHVWFGWFSSMVLALVAGYGYRLWRIAVTYGMTVIFWTLVYAMLSPHMGIEDAMLVAGTGRGLPPDASSLAWLAQGCESTVNNYILGPLIVAMVLQRILGK